MIKSSLSSAVATGDTTPMPHEQWVAFIRQCMGECGLEVPGERYRSYMRDQELHGRFLRSLILPPLLTQYAVLDCLKFKAIAHHDPYLWKRLAAAMAFGYAHGQVLHRFRFSGDEQSGWGAEAAAVFNTAIMLYDYLADEKGFTAEGEGEKISGMVGHLLVGDVDLGLHLADRMARDTADTTLHLLICFMSAWVRYVRDAEDFSPDSRPWRQVCRLIFELFKAEVAVSSMRTDPETLSVDEMDLVAMKSAGPSVAIAWMVIAAGNDPEIQANQTLLNVAQILGEIFWLVDDLVDAMRDMACGNPNRLIMKVMDSCRYRYGEIDIDVLKRAAEEESKEIVRKLAHLESTASSKISTASRCGAVRELMTFTRMYVAGWLQLVPE